MTTYSPHGTPPVQVARQAASDTPQTDIPRRRIEIAWQRRNGDVEMSAHAIPSKALFEECFSAFAHGTPIQTPDGPVAIEDILPGDEVLTQEHGPLPVLWRGSLTCHATPQDRCRRLTRIMTDGFGIGRPVRDLLIGPAARVIHRPRNLPTGGPRSQVLVPVSALQDGATIIPVTPPSAVQLYHLALPVHSTLRVGGLAMESYHPGISLRSTLSPRQLALFLSIFPHIDQPGDFGPLTYPRLSERDLSEAPAA
ncbi:Hint domain-containing protein [Lutimaribacter pacificus]|uniref:Hint domain-containing protein n=1 Tax=Lutimaribacter pacificus TaxID=391948 RepID=A0A1H0CXY7_9RHOB|nr:Hint domain-containing protein [Lutimaribacter pacificus]SDN62728.1 Hint domain-containing protein [Lutimaribacter pacificus]SHJ39407.1 Hint domain-containing protein [Lutimaribacter pacificus]